MDQASLNGLRASHDDGANGVLNYTPAKYARHLARYIRDPSTVRARTLEQYGSAPPIEKIRRWRADHELLHARPVNLYLDPKYDQKFRERAPKRESLPPAPEPAFSPDLAVSPTTARRAALAFAEPPWRLGVSIASDRIAEVAHSFGLTLADITGPSRKVYIARVRALIALLMVERGNSRAQVGRWLNRDHSTIIHALSRFAYFAARHPPLQEAYDHFHRAWSPPREAASQPEGEQTDAVRES